MRKRLNDWEPVSDWIHAVLIQDHRKMHSTKRGRVGDTKRLGPSITDPNHPEHHWEVGNSYLGSGNYGKPYIEFGTSVPYSQWYLQWRRSHRRRGHLLARVRARRSIAQILGEYVRDGR